MKVWVLTGDTVEDCMGELLEAGKVVGVFTSYEAADAELKKIIEEGTGSYWRKERDYDIEMYEGTS